MLVKTIGSSSDVFETELLFQKAQKEMLVLQRRNELPFNELQELGFADSFVNYIDSYHSQAPNCSWANSLTK